MSAWAGSTRSRVAGCLALLAAILLAGQARALEDCGNGSDDDQDTLADCADVDCIRSSECSVGVLRNFRVVPGMRNIYFVSWPDVPDVPDAAGLRGPGGHPCVGLAGGPMDGDGAATAHDVLCAFFGSGDPLNLDNASMAIGRILRMPCPLMEAAIALNDRFVGFSVSGPNFPLVGREGYMVLVASDGTAMDNEGIVGGWCDPSRGPRLVEPHPLGCLRHASLQDRRFGSAVDTADEVLCGVEGQDWDDADGDGDPDACDHGLFDGLHAVSVATFDNDPTRAPETDDTFVVRTIVPTDLGPSFLGRDFDLEDGSGYVLEVGPNQVPREHLEPPSPDCG